MNLRPIGQFILHPSSSKHFYRLYYSEAVGDRRIYRERKLVGWSPSSLYSIVSQPSEYKHFLPACYDSQVLEQISDTRFRAELFIGIPPFIKESYVSDVTLVPRSAVKVLGMDSKLFNHLTCQWTFKPGVPGIENSCWIFFDLDFEPKLYRKIISSVFEPMAKTTVAAFLIRAKHVLGKEASLNVKTHQLK